MEAYAIRSHLPCHYRLESSAIARCRSLLRSRTRCRARLSTTAACAPDSRCQTGISSPTRRCSLRQARITAQAASAAGEPLPPVADDAEALRASARRQNQISPQTIVLLLLASAASLYLYQAGYFTWAKEYFYRTQLGRSGFPAAFSLIFLSEIGDKTFFIAALLAAKFGRWLSFSASVAALSVMTVVSVAIGIIFSRVPEFMKSGLPIGEWGSAAFLIYFGIKTLRDAWQTPSEGEGGEMGEAQQSVDSAEASGKISGTSKGQAFMQVASLVFVAEWGDRSMLATIALAISQSPIGVAGGAMAGHAIATFIAVIGGAFVSQYISEKTIGYISGSLFLVFAALTLLGIF